MLISADNNNDTGSLSALRAQSRKQVNRLGANRIKDNLTLSPLRATSHPAPSVLSRSSTTTRNDGGRRSTSLFDLPSSGGSLVGKLAAPTRPINPLTAGLAGNRSNSAGGLSSISGATSSASLGLRLDSARSLLSQQRSRSTSIDNGSRFLIASSNPRRANAFGISLSNSSLNLLG